MKLKCISLVDICKDGNYYKYTYALMGSSFFSKTFYKLSLKSRLPHFL